MSDAASTDRGPGAWAHAFLAVILCLVAANLVLLVRHGNYAFDQYGNVVVSLMLLFNHIAFHYTKVGWPGVLMKGIAYAWLGFGLVYTIYFAWQAGTLGP